MLSDKVVIVPKLIDGTSVERKKGKVIKQKHQRVKFTGLVTFKDVAVMFLSLYIYIYEVMFLYIYIYMKLCFYIYIYI